MEYQIEVITVPIIDVDGANTFYIDQRRFVELIGSRLASASEGRPDSGAAVTSSTSDDRCERKWRPDFTGDGARSKVQWRVAARRGRLKTMAGPDRSVESRKASVRAKVEHPFQIVNRDFGFVKTRYRGIGKNLSHLHMLFP